MNLPKELHCWDEFIEQKNSINPPKLKRIQAIFDFKSRWLISTRFKSLEVSIDFKDPLILQGHNVMTRLLFAWSARECLSCALGRKVWELEIPDSKLSKDFHEKLYAGGKNQLIAETIYRGRLDGKQRQALERFQESPGSDIYPVLNVLRNASAHGSMTPTGAGLTQDENLIELISLGTKRLILDSSERFGDWVKRDGLIQLVEDEKRERSTR